MRLLHVRTRRLEEFARQPAVSYAILSHVWGNREVTFRDVQAAGDGLHEALDGIEEAFSSSSNGERGASHVRQKDGWSKIMKSCEVAKGLGLSYIWIDTCCIDSASSAELSEAINSMFEWYEGADICLAFLNDVVSTNPEHDDTLAVQEHARDDQPRENRRQEYQNGCHKKEEEDHEQDQGREQNQNRNQTPSANGTREDFATQFRKSRWFTRGWTLQELVAPMELSFYSKHWKPLGTRDFLKKTIMDITGVPESVLESGLGERKAHLKGICVGEKMSWAARRETSRPEDVAYSLLGIFDINMPLIYGEGKVKAFRRLQEEIIRSTGDDSIYAWRYPAHEALRQDYWGLLAESPDAFGRYRDFMPRNSKYLTRSANRATVTSARGLHVELAITPYPKDRSGSIFLGFLDCDMRRDKSPAFLTPAILLQKTSWYNETDFVRIRPDILVLLMMNRIVFPDELVDIKKRDLAMPEAVPRQIYVPHHLPAPRSPQGVVFRPVVVAGPDEASFKVSVVSRSPTWQYFVDQSDVYVLNFETAPVPSVEELKEVIIIGIMELEIGDGWNSWHVSLVMGLEPLPGNSFATPALYVKPWCAFETQSRLAAGDFEEVLNPDTRMKYHALQKQSLHARLDLQSRFARQFYKVVLEVGKADDSKSKMVPWRPSRDGSKLESHEKKK